MKTNSLKFVRIKVFTIQDWLGSRTTSEKTPIRFSNCEMSFSDFFNPYMKHLFTTNGKNQSSIKFSCQLKFTKIPSEMPVTLAQ